MSNAFRCDRCREFKDGEPCVIKPLESRFPHEADKRRVDDFYVHFRITRRRGDVPNVDICPNCVQEIVLIASRDVANVQGEAKAVFVEAQS